MVACCVLMSHDPRSLSTNDGFTSPCSKRSEINDGAVKLLAAKFSETSKKNFQHWCFAVNCYPLQIETENLKLRTIHFVHIYKRIALSEITSRTGRVSRKNAPCTSLSSDAYTPPALQSYELPKWLCSRFSEILQQVLQEKAATTAFVSEDWLEQLIINQDGGNCFLTYVCNYHTLWTVSCLPVKWP